MFDMKDLKNYISENPLIGKVVIITDKESIYCNEWGIIKDFDGEYFHIAIANDPHTMPIFSRNEFKVPRRGVNFK